MILGLHLGFVDARRLLASLSLKAALEFGHHLADPEDHRDHRLWTELSKWSLPPPLSPNLALAAHLWSRGPQADVDRSHCGEHWGAWLSSPP